jgi:hypothetical protein
MEEVIRAGTLNELNNGLEKVNIQQSCSLKLGYQTVKQLAVILLIKVRAKKDHLGDGG